MSKAKDFLRHLSQADFGKERSALAEDFISRSRALQRIKKVIHEEWDEGNLTEEELEELIDWIRAWFL